MTLSIAFLRASTSLIIALGPLEASRPSRPQRILEPTQTTATHYTS
jgi:hypothetical protein